MFAERAWFAMCPEQKERGSPPSDDFRAGKTERPSKGISVIHRESFTMTAPVRRRKRDKKQDRRYIKTPAAGANKEIAACRERSIFSTSL